MRRIIRVSTAPARKSKYSRSASLATDARAEAEESNELPPVAAPDNPKYGGRYFVDFRARSAASYGHAFLWYGRLKQDGKVGAIEVAGLHPATDSVVPYILGHIIPVPSETGKSYGDLDEQYLTASYRPRRGTCSPTSSRSRQVRLSGRLEPSTAPGSSRTSRATWACALRRFRR